MFITNADVFFLYSGWAGPSWFARPISKYYLAAVTLFVLLGRSSAQELSLMAFVLICSRISMLTQHWFYGETNSLVLLLEEDTHAWGLKQDDHYVPFQLRLSYGSVPEIQLTHCQCNQNWHLVVYTCLFLASVWVWCWWRLRAAFHLLHYKELPVFWYRDQRVHQESPEQLVKLGCLAFPE